MNRRTFALGSVFAGFLASARKVFGLAPTPAPLPPILKPDELLNRYGALIQVGRRRYVPSKHGWILTHHRDPVTDVWEKNTALDAATTDLPLARAVAPALKPYGPYEPSLVPMLDDLYDRVQAVLLEQSEELYSHERLQAVLQPPPYEEHTLEALLEHIWALRCYHNRTHCDGHRGLVMLDQLQTVETAQGTRRLCTWCHQQYLADLAIKERNDVPQDSPHA